MLSCFFSSAETSLTSVNTARIHELDTNGNKKAKIITKLNKKKGMVLGVILLGNTLANITVSSLATRFFVDVLNSEGLGTTISSIVMTMVILLFAEVIPKTYAIHNPEKIALFSAPIIKIFTVVFYPVVRFIQLIVDFMFKVIGLSKDREIISAADAIRNLVSLHKNDHTMTKQDIDMLNSVLDLAETEIASIMTHRKDIIAVDAELNKAEMIQAVLDAKHINVPLWRDNIDNIEGIINVYELIIGLRKSASYEEVDLHKLIRKPIFVPDTTPLSTQLFNFRMHENNFAVVVDEYGSLQGIVSLSDILEEIVGDIHYNDKEDIKKISAVEYSIDGKVSVRDIKRKLQWDIPDKDASTIAGLIINSIERIPDTGECFDLFGIQFSILAKEGNFIKRVGAKNKAIKTFHQPK